MPGERVFFKRRLHHATQARKSTTEIGHPCGDPDPRSRWQPDHPTKHSIAVRSATTSMFPATRSVSLASLISIVPKGDGEAAFTTFTASSRSSVVVTGRSFAHKIAVISYTIVKNQVEYDESIWATRDAHREKRLEMKLKRQAKQLGYELVPIERKAA